jgi:hypothetical protein
MVSRKLTVVLAILLALLLSACAPAGNQPEAIGTGIVPGDLPEAAIEAQRFLSESLGVDVEQVKVVSVEQVEWPDGCLGLGQANESCIAVVTPGFNITLEVDGQAYEVHTDEQGVNIRQAP